MKSRGRTTIAVLRGILGPLTGSELGFAGVTGLSSSWVNKASYGKIDVTPKAALKIASATGISADWVLQGNPALPPVEADNRTPYTRESYDHHVKAVSSSRRPPPAVVSGALVSVLIGIDAANQSGRGLTAMNDLAEFAKVMLSKYCPPGGSSNVNQHFVEKALHEARTIRNWITHHKGDTAISSASSRSEASSDS